MLSQTLGVAMVAAALLFLCWRSLIRFILLLFLISICLPIAYCSLTVVHLKEPLYRVLVMP